MQLARDSKQIGNIIRRARKKQALTQGQLGEKTGLRQATVSQVENGHPSARIDTLLALFGALDLELCVAPRSKNWTIELGGDS
jgi:HTH-type transcriptional regulator/antitoxin HipB